MDKISVCMATRNGEKYLIKQLESILIQIDQDDEVIISDDSSTDRTVEVIKYLKDSRIQLLENNTYLNPIFNFENALRQATGEIIALSDQDDIWLNNKTAVIRREFKDHHAGIKLIVLDGLIVDENENILYDSIFDKMRSGRGLMKNIYANTYMGCCMAFSRDLLKIALPFPATIPMHDMWLGQLAELFGSASFVREKTIKYRRHQTTSTNFDRRLEIGPQLLRRYHLTTSIMKRFLSIKLGKEHNSQRL